MADWVIPLPMSSDERYFTIVAVGDEKRMNEVASKRNSRKKKLPAQMAVPNLLLAVALWYVLQDVTEFSKNQITVAAFVYGALGILSMPIVSKVIAQNPWTVRQVDKILMDSERPDQVVSYELVEQVSVSQATRDRARPPLAWADPINKGDYVVVQPARTLGYRRNNIPDVLQQLTGRFEK